MPTRLLSRHVTSTSVSPSVAPSYTTEDANAADIELSSWNEGSSLHRNSVISAPPPYTSSSSAFRPTVNLQVQTSGKPLLSLPIPPRAVPIPILEVNPEDNSVAHEPRFVSIRPKRGSGSSCLVSGEAYLANSETDIEWKPLSTTTYRFGPGRPPSVSLFLPASHQQHEPNGVEGQEEPWDTCNILSTSLISRSQMLRHTRLGTFEWRYARRAERRALKANSVLVLERIIHVAVAGSPKNEEIRRTVALFLRNQELRTPGTSAGSASNGGRLMIDLSVWEEGDGEGGKVDREMAVVLVVTTVVAMLKKEVDRRRAQQIGVMVAVAGGAH